MLDRVQTVFNFLLLAYIHIILRSTCLHLMVYMKPLKPSYVLKVNSLKPRWALIIGSSINAF